MSKIKVTADTVLSILKGIMEDEEINETMTDTSAPEDWQGKTIEEILNVEYFTFRHRPIDTEVIIKKLIEKSETPNALLALTRSFCLVYIDELTRAYSKQNDIINLKVGLEWWLQTEKVKLLENLVENMSISTTGERISVQIGSETKQVLLALGNLNVSEIQETTEFGEMAVCELSVEMIFYPEATSLIDYEVAFLIPDDIDTSESSDDESSFNISDYFIKVPVNGLNISTSMTQKSVPYVNNTSDTGSINLSKVKTIVMTFDGYKNNSFITSLTEFSLRSDYKYSETSGFEVNSDDVDNNKEFILKLTRDEDEFYYSCVIKDHQITVQEDTGNETHSLTLTARGIKDGNT